MNLLVLAEQITGDSKKRTYDLSIWENVPLLKVINDQIVWRSWLVIWR